MPRPLRYSGPWQPIEITARTFQGRFLLQPSKRLNALIAGVLAVARTKFDVRIYDFVFLSNHFHMLAAAPSPAVMSAFMCFVMSNIAREAGRLHDWSGHFWDQRYRAIPITDAASLIDRMRYLLAHGCKEGLVSHPSLWEGLQAVDALTQGLPIKGIWVDRTSMYQARKRVNAVVNENDFTSEVELVLDVLPDWEDLSVEERQTQAKALVEEAALSALAPRKGKSPRASYRPRSPHYRPRRLKRGFAPLCHASTKALRKAFKEAYRAFVNAYRIASERLRERLPELGFPAHSQVMAFAVPETG